jgi:adenylylsulfate kinase
MRPSPEMAAPVVWFTGLSGSGKTTIARQVCRKLEQVGLPVEYLDGDAIRSVFPNTGFSRVDRDAHIRRVAFMASRLEHHGIAVVVSLVSPYVASRVFARNMCRNFVEVHVSTPLAVCEARDVKGLYAKARRGEIRNFTGLDDPYEPPEKPELELDTSTMSLEEATSLVMGRIGFGYRPADRPRSNVERAESVSLSDRP